MIPYRLPTYQHFEVCSLENHTTVDPWCFLRLNPDVFRALLSAVVTRM